jgi:membrane protein implicated in regulation of membrane protease activity
MTDPSGHWFLAIGLVICTAILLAVALAWYDFVIQIGTVSGLLVATPTTPTTTQILGQLIFALILTIVGIFLLRFFEPYGPPGQQNRVIGETRALRDEVAIRGPLLPDLVR